MPRRLRSEPIQRGAVGSLLAAGFGLGGAYMNVVHVFPERRYTFPGRNRAWYVRLVSPSGETLAISEAYASKWNAKRAARKNFAGLPVKEMPQ